MIKRLRRRMSMLVIGVLVLVSIGIVVAIYEVNNQNIISQAESALEAIAESSGVLPAGEDRTPPEILDGVTPPPKPEGEEESRRSPGSRGETETASRPTMGGFRWGDFRPLDGFGELRGRGMSREEVASLSNYYTMTLDGEGQIQSWESDRAELYNQETLQAFADQVCQQGRSSGRIDDQFYRLVDTEEDQQLLIVLDARLEMLAGQRVLKVTVLVAGIACLALSLGAWFLIRKMIQPVEEAFTKQQQFVWDASHELKTPLAVISANADVLEGEIGENEYLGYIQSEVKRTDSLVKNLLTLARMDRGTVGQDLAEMDLSEAVLGVLLPFESTVFEAGKTLESRIQENVKITGNEAMVQQLVVILLSNALKYSDEHGVIRVTLEKKNRVTELRVENTGKGIEAKDLERIFDRFYRTDASRNSETGGEGLGLAIAKSIVEIHHGKIRAESKTGENAVFIVNFG
ncbi:MAG: HAMP domain-containing histidine kinase [Clostridia bacterium]|nr:HAMP domain-containing histidine kinase [Clostridia bacterium]